MFIYICKYVVLILANVMTNIAGGVPQLFRSNHITIYAKMWNDVGSEIAHLSLLVLVLARECPLNILCGLG
jgi:hypothetical protein